MLPETSPIDQLWRALRRRTRSAVVAGLVTFAIGIAAGLTVVPLYEAQAKLVVDRERKTVDLGQGVNSPLEDDAYSILNTHRELIQSQPVLRSAIEATGLAMQPPYGQVSDPVQLLGSRFRVLASRESWILDLGLRDESPERARKVLGSLVESYLAEESRRRTEISDSSLGFLRQQVDVARRALDLARANEQQLLRERGVIGLDPDSNHLTAELAALKIKEVELSTTCAASDALGGQVEEAARIADPATRLDALVAVPEIRRELVVAQALQSVAELDEQRQGLAKTYKDRHPRMVESTAQLNVARERLAQAVESTRIGLLQAGQAAHQQADEVAVRAKALELQIRDYREGLAALRARSEETATAGQLFQTLLQRLHEQEVNSRLSAPRISVAQPPIAASKPVNIRRGLFLLGALVAGASAAVAAALLHETLDRHVREPATLPETSGIPLLGRLPHVPNLPVVGPDPSPIRSEDPRVRAIEDCVKALRTAIQLVVDPAVGLRTIAIVSPSVGDGRTSVAARLATAMAISGRRTLLVDGDLVRPAIHVQLAIVPDALGLTDLLGGVPEAVPLATLHPQLHVLLAGTQAENSAELLHGTRLVEVSQRWAAEYDVVIIDTSPLDTAEALELVDAADHALLVIRDRYTRRDRLRHALDRLARFPGKLIGVVANGDQDAPIDPRSPNRTGTHLEPGVSGAMRRALRL